MKYYIFLACTFVALGVNADFLNEEVDGGKYIYTIDLTQVADDKIKVELSVPDMEENEVIFYLPKIIPGTYKEADYGRFVDNLQAFDKKGKLLNVSRIDDNSWKIEKAKKLKTLTYDVNDTYDADMGTNDVYPMAGTNIEKNENFVVNTSGFFGYFKGMLENDFEVNFIRPKQFYGSTGLIPESANVKYTYQLDRENKNTEEDEKFVDKFVTENYHDLIDSPIMYNQPDTTLIDVGGTEVLVSVYSPKGMVTSKFIAENIDEILNAQMNYLGGELPVDKYAFIFYCEDPTKLAPVQGALEHSYSSFYYFPEIPQENLRQTVKDVAAHEFFHIVTPLNIHSEEIQYFDFNEPNMSEHLWMYEGVTEYSAHHVQVKYDIISPEQFLATMQQKMQIATTAFNDTLSFTDLSKYTISKYPEQYGNVYQKGALIGMLLDIQLRYYSDGEYGIQDLMKDLAVKFGKDKPFKDEELFDTIVSLTYPEIEGFFTDYLQKGSVLPYETVMKMVGVNYEAERVSSDYSFGNINIGFDTDENKLVVAGVNSMNHFGRQMGYEEGDLLVSINGREIPTTGLQNFVNEVKAEMKEGDTFVVEILRPNEEGEKEAMTLQAEIAKMEKKEFHLLSFDENATEHQLTIRNAWLRP